MSIIRWQPRATLRPWSSLQEIETMQREMARLFDWTFGQEQGDGMPHDGTWAPAVDVVQETDRFRVRADLPGMKREDIEVTINGDTLTISGEKKQESEAKKEGVYRAERYYGKFSRSLTLPSSVDASKIEATYRDGVLDISVPKSEAAQARSIKIQA
jgi:HSP20 family protein